MAGHWELMPRSQTWRVLIHPLLLSSCVSPGKSVHPSEPWSPLLHPVDNNCYFRWLWRGSRESHSRTSRNCETLDKHLLPCAQRILGNVQGPPGSGPDCKNHLNGPWGTWPARLQPVTSCLHLSDIFFLPVFISARHPFSSQHQVQATVGHR